MQNYSLIVRKANKVKACLLLKRKNGVKVLLKGFFYLKAGKAEIAKFEY